MKMKKTIITTFACLGLIGFSSCTSFLDENPKSSITSAAYYETEAQAEANVNYLYRTGAPTRIGAGQGAYLGPFASVTGMLTG